MEKWIYTLKAVANKLKITPHTIFELWARDWEETLWLSTTFKTADVYSFECNPATINIWKSKVKSNKKIHCIEAAVSDKNWKIKFYPTTKDTITTWEDGNPWASSLFKASWKYEIEKYVQKEIEVNSIKLDSFMQENNINNVDILWMDIQGAEWLALKGLWNNLKNVNLIYTEVEFLEIYKWQALYKDIKNMLDEDFILYKFVNYWFYSSDCIFLNKRFLKKNSKIKYIYAYFRSFFLYPIHFVISYTTHIWWKIFSNLKNLSKNK